jgi:LacI family transcriptional regulator
LTGKSEKASQKKSKTITLKAVAEHLGLTPGTVSAVLNNAPSSRSIPQHTKSRIHAAAKELNYKPNFFARSLRQKRTYMVGVIAEEIGDAYGSMVISGIERCLRERNYLFLTVTHHHDPKELEQYTQLLMERGVEGFITVDTSLDRSPALPTVAVAGHKKVKGVTNIQLDHMHAARIALEHLVKLGHREIAFMKGHPLSSDAESRWQGIQDVAHELGVHIDPELALELESLESSPQLGYPLTRKLLQRGKRFTALFAYNDISAIGAIRAMHEAGLHVPQDLSVVGFDDIQGAAFHNPSLTTVRQPLSKMGEIAAQALIERIEGRKDYAATIAIEPELVVRESTAAARNGSR